MHTQLISKFSMQLTFHFNIMRYLNCTLCSATLYMHNMCNCIWVFYTKYTFLI